MGVYFGAGSLRAHLEYKHDATLNDAADVKADEDVKPDPILPPIIKLLAEDQVAANEEAFRVSIRKEEAAFKPLGEKVTDWTLEGEAYFNYEPWATMLSLSLGEHGSSRQFEIYHADVSVPGFREYHSRLQPWIMFYIDAASYIDIDDTNWKFFLL